jgi:glycerol uptake facilitator-like aquaporin
VTGPAPLARRLLAELLGSAFLAALVIGSGIAAQQLSPHSHVTAREAATVVIPQTS